MTQKDREEVHFLARVIVTEALLIKHDTTKTRGLHLEIQNPSEIDRRTQTFDVFEVGLFQPLSNVPTTSTPQIQ